jgi:hypothetical protein
MNIKPMIGELEIPGLQRIGADQKRRIIDIPVPGLEGGLSQDLGSESIIIVVEGSLAQDEARDGFLESVREMYDAGEPVDFVADIVTATEVFEILIESISVREVAGTESPFSYRLTLRQYVPPPEPTSDNGFGDGFPGLDELGPDLDLGLDIEAGSLFDMMEIPDLLSIPDFGDPSPPLSTAMEGVRSSMGALDGISGALDSLFGSGS